PTPERIGKYRVKSTFQLGEASIIAAKLGVVTVSDFRPAELPLGGEGAPLMPYLDYILFRHPK
ncbi:MAG: anhydro-N-acetylmuramic acid kinase, partial [Chlorobiales bacterium]|nr:anhydro-N-acetylmuramic acid kinase [Chlorobiales bacterium]